MSTERFELFYWPAIQGRGEFVRLAFEDAGADWVDVARLPAEQGGGVPALMKLLRDESLSTPPFAPPFVRAGDVVVAQTANVLQFVGPRIGLAPADERGRLWAHQLQLTISDLVSEVHDTHHPVSTALYYEDQKPEAKRRSAEFLKSRLPKFMGYFERALARNGGEHLVGGATSYVDLSMFQVMTGIAYAFPRAWHRVAEALPGLVALRDRVAARPRVAAYLASPRRVAFNENGIFRRYPELDEG
ncbi:MAG: glutathione S-transferase family protein [Polyangiales bacterium]